MLSFVSLVPVAGILGAVGYFTSLAADLGLAGSADRGHAVARRSALRMGPDAAAAGQPLVLVINRKCPFAQRAWFGMEESGLAFDLKEAELYPTKPQWLWDLNPSGKVPVLVDEGGAPIVESEDIIDAIAARAPAAFGGGADAERVADWRSIIRWELLPAGEGLHFSWGDHPLGDVLRKLDDLVVGPYVVGDTFTLADVSAAPMMQRFFDDGLVHKRYARLHAWWEAVRSRPAFAKTMVANKAYWWWW